MTPAPGLEALSERDRAEYWASLALRNAGGLGRNGACRLLHFFGSAYDAVQSPRRWQEAGVPSATAERFSRGLWKEKAAPEWQSAHGLDARIILWTDADYPRMLRNIPDAPPVLYVRGDPALLNTPALAVAGSRFCSRAGQDMAARAGAEISSGGVTVVSGASAGIEQAAQLSARLQAGRSVIILPCGISAPMQNAGLCRLVGENGLLASEFPPLMPASRTTFPVRNRIISGLSLGVLVVEAASARSGSLITARIAAEQGRSVYVPAPGVLKGPYPEGTKSLLLEGAHPVSGTQDILADLLPHLKSELARLEETASGGAGLQRSAPDGREDGEDGGPAEESAEAAPVLRQATPCRDGETEVRKGGARKTAGRDVSRETPEDLVPRILKEGPLDHDGLLRRLQQLEDGWTPQRLGSTLLMLEIAHGVRRRTDSRYEAD